MGKILACLACIVLGIFGLCNPTLDGEFPAVVGILVGIFCIIIGIIGIFR